MKIYDISQEVFSCAVYPGDPKPEKQVLCATERGDLYNLTAFSMCAHNGTHIDAPFHFLGDGKTVDRMDLGSFVGECYVARHEGAVTDADALDILFETVSATATVGLTRDLTPYLNAAGKMVIIGTMYLGRVGPISLALALNSNKKHQNIIQDPTEEISIG